MQTAPKVVSRRELTAAQVPTANDRQLDISQVLRIDQVFEIHVLRRKAAQAEDKGPFIIYVGTGSIGEGLAKRGICAIFKSEERVGVEEYFLNFGRITYKVRESFIFVFTKGDYNYPVFLKLFEILANSPSRQ